MWIGANDRDVEGGWRCPDGTAIVYSNWANGQPDNYQGGEDCTELGWAEVDPWWRQSTVERRPCMRL